MFAHDNRGGVLETVDGFYHEYRSLEFQPDGVIYRDRFGEKMRLAYDRLNAKTRALLYPEREARFETRVKSFTVSSPLYRNLEVTVRYRIAVDETREPVPEAENLVFYAPWLNQKNFTDVGRHMNNRYLRYLTERYGYTVFSVELDTRLSDVRDREKSACFPESGFHETVFEIQRKIEERHKLPHRKLLISGDSFGGRMAEQLGVHHPDKVAAVVMNGGDSFDLPSEHSEVGWLAINTYGDGSSRAANQRLREACRQHGISYLHVETPPQWRLVGDSNFFHSVNGDALDLHVSFLHAMVQLRETHGRIPQRAEWPVVYRGQSLPGERFLEEWRQVPRIKTFEGEVPEGVIGLSRDFREGRQPLGVVLYVHDHNLRWLNGLRDNLGYFAWHGFVAVGLQTSNDHEGDLRRVRKLLRWAGQRWGGELPVYLAGDRVGGQHAMTAAFQEEQKHVQAVATLNSDVREAFEVYGSVNRPSGDKARALSPQTFYEQANEPMALFYLDGLTVQDHLRKYAEVGYHRHYGKPVNVVYASDTYHAWYAMLRDMVRFFLVTENN